MVKFLTDNFIVSLPRNRVHLSLRRFLSPSVLGACFIGTYVPLRDSIKRKRPPYDNKSLFRPLPTVKRKRPQFRKISTKGI